MNLEEKKVLLNRWQTPFHWKDKEWWYSGFYDASNDIYFSFYFVRVNLSDKFGFTLFDNKNNTTTKYENIMFLEKEQIKDKLSLNYHSKKVSIEYNGDEKSGWKFLFKNATYDIVLEFEQGIPYFTKFDNEFKYNYSLLHFFQNATNGVIQTSNKTYEIKNAMCYSDHCFGTVPRHSKWHWLAVQNDKIALASLVNYGSFSQRYTQIYFNKDSKCNKKNEWIRLSQEVSFESIMDERFTENWRITSPDLDLIAEPLMHTLHRQKIPPVIPFLVNINHYEFLVKVSGKARIDGVWTRLDDMYGVLEEHKALW